MTINTDPLLYLDIDGTLLRRRQPGIFDAFEIAPGCLDFLEWATARFRCRWLSIRCRNGLPEGARRAFRHAGARLDDPRWAVLDQVETVAWSVNKTDVLNPATDFWWLDDAVTESDRDWLLGHQCADRLIQVMADHDPAALAVARSILQRVVSSTWRELQ